MIFLKRPIAQCGHQAHLGVVNATRDDCRHVGKTRGQAAKHVGPAAAVAMHEIRL